MSPRTSRETSNRKYENVWERAVSYRAMTKIPTRNNASSQISSSKGNQSVPAVRFGELNDYSTKIFEPHKTAHVSFGLKVQAPKTGLN